MVAWPFFFLKNSQATWSRGLFEKIQEKITTFKGKNVLKLPRFLEDEGRFLAFFFLKLPYLAKKVYSN
jgi:hypothetical protein